MTHQKHHSHKNHEIVGLDLPDDIGNLSKSDIARLYQELKLHQIELEIQNEELHQTQVDLEESRAKYIDLYDFAPVCYFSLDGKGFICEVNLTGCNLLGISRKLLIGKPFLLFIKEHDRTTFFNFKESLLGQRESQVCEVTLLPKDKSSIEAQIKGIVLSPKDGNTSVRLAVIDITEKKRAEQERKLMEAQLQQVQKLESIGVLAGGIAHDFNNLLLAIMGNADLALMDLPTQSPAKQNIEEIQKVSKRASETVQQLLTYSGRGRFESGPLELSDVLSKMLDLLRVSISRKVNFELNLDNEAPHMEGDITQIRQVIMNLVINAAEAIGDRNGNLSVRTGLMFVTKDGLDQDYFHEGVSGGQYVFLEVMDDGNGMDEQTKSRIFEPFFTTKFTGRGLGMATVLGIVRRHHGAICIDSTPGFGTQCRVLFPVSESVMTQEENVPAGYDDWKGTGKVLVIDDETSVRDVTERMLMRFGFTVITAEDGHEGVSLYLQHHDDIVAILLDLTMPKMDGEQTLKELRKYDCNAPILLASGFTRENIEEQFSSEAIAGFIHKPYRAETLSRVLRNLLSTDVPEKMETGKMHKITG